jgi:hypothetical protein
MLLPQRGAGRGNKRTQPCHRARDGDAWFPLRASETAALSSKNLATDVNR